MFKRIKNLLDISRYTVEELKTSITTHDGYIRVKPSVTTIKESTGTYPSPYEIEFRPAKIINTIEIDPFTDITNETSQQSPDDTAARN